MASSLQAQATQLHLKDEAHEYFRRLCAHHLRAAHDSGNTVDTAICEFLDAHGRAPWPGYHEHRTHLLDTEGDKFWTRQQTAVTGPSFMRDSKPARKVLQAVPPILTSKIGKVVKDYFLVLANDPAVARGRESLSAEELKRMVLGSNTVSTEPSLDDDTIEEVAQQLWLRYEDAVKQLSLHYLRRATPTLEDKQVDLAIISEHESEIEQAVVNFLSAHGESFWPTGPHRTHLLEPNERPEKWKMNWSSPSRYDDDGGPVYEYHGRMDGKEVRSFKSTFAGMLPNQREQVARSKIGQILKTYFTHLFPHTKATDELEDDAVRKLAQLLSEPTELFKRFVHLQGNDDADHDEDIGFDGRPLNAPNRFKLKYRCWCHFCYRAYPSTQEVCYHRPVLGPAPPNPSLSAPSRQTNTTAAPPISSIDGVSRQTQAYPAQPVAQTTAPS